MGTNNYWLYRLFSFFAFFFRIIGVNAQIIFIECFCHVGLNF